MCHQAVQAATMIGISVQSFLLPQLQLPPSLQGITLLSCSVSTLL